MPFASIVMVMIAKAKVRATVETVEGKQFIQFLSKIQVKAPKRHNLFHVNCNNYSNNSPCSNYFLNKDGYHGDKYGNDNNSNNNGKNNLEYLLNSAIKIYNNPIYPLSLGAKRFNS